MLFDKEEGMDEEIKSGLNAPFGARCFLTTTKRTAVFSL